MEEKFCLKWNDFQENTLKTFSKLRNEDEFFDVTLVSDDQKQMLAHKVILSSCSEYFKNILKMNKHSHPMLCLTGISSIEMEKVLDYAYHGEVQIFQEDINKFLDIAQILKLDGLLGSRTENELEKDLNTHRPHEPTSKQESINDFDTNITNETKLNVCGQTQATVSNVSVNGNLSVDKIEQKVREYLGKNEDGDYVCNLCGKVGYGGPRCITSIKNHIETHLEGISYTCILCGKQFGSRNLLSNHKSVKHRNK